MALGHWLDPLARQILKFTGNLPQSKSVLSQARSKSDKYIDFELQALKEAQNPTHINSELKIDVNRATPSDWKKLPGCTDEMIELLIKLQKGGVQLSDEEDLAKLLELPKKLANEWSQHLIFRWYGNSPPINNTVELLDLNAASAYKLEKNLNWPKDRFKRLIWERQKGCFKNLADLQERLSLPAYVIEELIGTVSFGKKSDGPNLPPSKPK